MKNKTTRNPSGAGSIRQRPDGRWEGRITVGRDPGTGRQKRRSVYADSQAEVLKAIQRLRVEQETGMYTEPSKLTVGAWLDIWLKEYTGHLKQGTRASYEGVTSTHLKPSLGAVNLQKLKPHQIQGFYNSLQAAGKSAKTVKNVHGVLHASMQQAVKMGYIRVNPTEGCALPRWVKREMKVLDTDTAPRFLSAIQGDRYEAVFYITLFTGIRQAEALGLTWDNVDVDGGTVTIAQQLIKEKKRQGRYYLDTTKTDNIRTIRPAVAVMNKLREQWRRQTEWRLRAGPAWDNLMNLVFTDELGKHLVQRTVVKHYKAIVKQIGEPDLRFHDMRHSFATMAIANGDDLLTVQRNLGHSQASTTLNVYGHCTAAMQTESAARMDEFIKKVEGEK